MSSCYHRPTIFINSKSIRITILLQRAISKQLKERIPKPLSYDIPTSMKLHPQVQYNVQKVGSLLVSMLEQLKVSVYNKASPYHR